MTLLTANTSALVASPARPATAESRSDRRSRLFPLGMLVVTCAAYANSLGGAFLFDDQSSIIENYRIHHLWPLWRVVAGSIRPVTDLSFALNYALGHAHAWGYHLVNLGIHLLAGLALLGLLVRTLRGPRLSARYGSAASGLAGLIALIWLIHPLQTQSVTYITQRAESLAGLCYLLTLYCAVRGAQLTWPNRWHGAAIVACALGMATKPTVVTAPVAVLLYDRAFLARSFHEIGRCRRNLYLGLAATWCLLPLLFTTLQGIAEPSAGYALRRVTPVEYAATQPGVVLHYLKLAFWPHPLALTYAWPIARTAPAILLPAVILGLLAVLIHVAGRRHPGVGFLGAWTVLTLAPSSSVIPIADLAFEHRMYLPLAGVVALAVVTLWELLRRFEMRSRWRRGLAWGLSVSVIAVLAAMTVLRNADYRSELSMWSDVVAKQPRSALGRINLGRALAQRGALEAAITQYAQALELEPNYAEAHNNWATALLKQGRLEEAEAHLLTALRLKPRYAQVHYNLGNVFAQEGRLEAATEQYARALRWEPHLADAHNNWGNILILQGQREAASTHYAQALQLDPHHAKARRNLERLGVRERPLR